MNRLKHKWVNIIIVFGALYLMFFMGGIFYTMWDENIQVSESKYYEYENLFNQKSIEKLNLIVTTKSKYRGITSSYLYDQKFNLFVFKVQLLNDNWHELITQENEATYENNDVIYERLPSFNFDMSLKTGVIPSVSHIYFKYSGDSIKTVYQNEELICYYCNFKTFSISYNEEPYDIIANANISMPMSVLFLKKNKFVYIILLTVAKGKEEMEPNLLYNMIRNK